MAGFSLTAICLSLNVCVFLPMAQTLSNHDQISGAGNEPVTTMMTTMDWLNGTEQDSMRKTEEHSGRNSTETENDRPPSCLSSMEDAEAIGGEMQQRNCSLVERSSGERSMSIPGWYSRQALWGRNILLYWNAIVSPIGILGNVICILVVSQKHNRGVSCSIYMGALAVADTLMLVANIGQVLLVHPLKFLPYQTFKNLCKLDYYITFASAHGGVMFILALLAERVIAVTKPLQAATLLSPKKAMYIIIAICISCIGFNIPRFPVTSASNSDPARNRGGHCIVLNTKLAVGYNLSSFFVTGVIPLIAIAIMNAVILIGVKNAKKNIAVKKYDASSTDGALTGVTAINTETNGASDDPDTDEKKPEPKPISTISKPRDYPKIAVDFRQKTRERRERQLTLMTIVMTTVFLVCSVPRFAHNLTWAFVNPWVSFERQATYMWSAIVTVNLYALNSAINFFLYMMTGSKFRADVIRLFRRK